MDADTKIATESVDLDIEEFLKDFRASAKPSKDLKDQLDIESAIPLDVALRRLDFGFKGCGFSGELGLRESDLAAANLLGTTGKGERIAPRRGDAPL